MFRVLGAIVLAFSLLLAAAPPASAATVKISVNGQAITDVQIAQRLALFKLERKSGQKNAETELINEALQVQEAEKLGFKITEADIDDAMGQVARQLKVSVSNLEKILTNNGVSVQTMRDRLKANVAWNRVSQTAINQRVTFSEADIDAEAKKKLTAANSFDYILKEILFITTDDKSSAAKRTAQANQYRKSFKGCSSAVELSLSYTDAAVRDVGRRHATQMEAPVAEELSKLDVGGITKPRVIQGAVQMLAVCGKEVSTDTTFLADQVRQTEGNGALQKEADKYLEELRAKAQIVYS